MKRTNLLLIFGVGYSLLFLLSILYIVPQYLSGGLGGFLLSLVTDTEPEGRFVGSIFHPLVWTLIPLTSIGLCVMSWITYSMEDRIDQSI